MSLRLSFDEITDIIKLQHRSEVAERTMAFYFEKPKDFHFEPGQFADLTLIDPPETDAEGNRRTFSIASAPHEERLTFATRMRDTAFKRVLRTLPLGYIPQDAVNANGSARPAKVASSSMMNRRGAIDSASSCSIL